MKARILIVILLISVVNLAACINIYNPAPDSGSGTTPTTPTTPPTPTIQPVPFENRTWVLDKYSKAVNIQNVIAGKEVNARFDSPSGKVSGTAGCNSYSAAYQRTVNKISISGLTTTMMSCPIPPGIMQQEAFFKDALLEAESCRIVGTKLEINCTQNRLLLFEPK